MKKFFMLTAAMVASVSGFAFDSTQNQGAVDKEVHQRTLKGETLDMQAAAGKTGGVKTEIMACALVHEGNAEARVVDAMIRGLFDAKMVINGAICNGANRDKLVAFAVGRGADPAALLDSTAAGGIDEKGSGFNGANFGQSRAATVGGGGRGSVSGS